ncbi:hypothetical protein C8R44DRAFT_734594 [Mycena epipterygia]|nr:hypothetical protein C8R44DRAFT_734594 [Mycena epipterygia]
MAAHRDPAPHSRPSPPRSLCPTMRSALKPLQSRKQDGDGDSGPESANTNITALKNLAQSTMPANATRCAAERAISPARGHGPRVGARRSPPCSRERRSPQNPHGRPRSSLIRMHERTPPHRRLDQLDDRRQIMGHIKGQGVRRGAEEDVTNTTVQESRYLLLRSCPTASSYKCHRICYITFLSGQGRGVKVDPVVLHPVLLQSRPASQKKKVVLQSAPNTKPETHRVIVARHRGLGFEVAIIERQKINKKEKKEGKKKSPLSERAELGYSKKGKRKREYNAPSASLETSPEITSSSLENPTGEVGETYTPNGRYEHFQAASHSSTFQIIPNNEIYFTVKAVE